MRVRSGGPLLAAAIGVLTAWAGSVPVLAAEPSQPMIVVLGAEADVDAAVARGKREHQVKPSLTFRHAARGYAAELTRGQARAIARHPSVLGVIPDSEVELVAQSTPAGIRRVGATKTPLTHIDGQDLASHRVNVDVAIIDTGIQPDHPDLRVAGGYDCTRPGTATERSWPSRWRDDHGHGTHVAGIVGALDNGSGVVGVAPGARLWSVRVFDATGYSRISWIACGIDWVTSKRDASDSSRPMIEVANMSLRDEGRDDGNCGYSIADIEHQAICRSTARGTTYVVAAGNDSRSASIWRPSAYNEVITVSAIADYDGKPGGLAGATCTSFGRRDVDDTFADFSNYGSDVDITAPGVCVRSTVRGSGYGTISGTSMATPHVAGGAALYLVAHPGASPAEVRAALRAAGAHDWRTSTDRDGTIDPLLDVSSFGAGPGLRVAPSTASLRIWSGTSATFTFRLTRLDGQSGTAAMSVEGLPDGVTASFSKTSFGGRDVGTATVRLSAEAGAPTSDTSVTLVATSGSVRGTASIRLRVDRDAAAPTVGTPAERFLVPSTVTTGGASILTSWTAADGGSGLASSNVGERRDGGSWTSLGTYGSTTRSRAARLPFGVDVQHRVRATDRSGNVSAFSEGPTIRLRAYSEGTSLATYSSGWRTTTQSGALGGSVRYATAAGASVTFRFTGRGVGFVTRTSAARGNAKVYIDGTYAGMLYLNSSSASARLVFARNLSAGSHTLRIVVLGTTDRPRVDVDGFVIIQ